MYTAPYHIPGTAAIQTKRTERLPQISECVMNLEVLSGRHVRGRGALRCPRRRPCAGLAWPMRLQIGIFHRRTKSDTAGISIPSALRGLDGSQVWGRKRTEISGSKHAGFAE